MPRPRLTAAALLAAVALCSASPRNEAQEKAKAEPSPAPGTPTVLPRPDFHFPGNVGRTYQDSDPAQFPQPVQAPKGAPNIVLILIDDAGFGQFSTFGGGVPSPTMDRLAAEGLRYNRFHTTALCSPPIATTTWAAWSMPSSRCRARTTRSSSTSRGTTAPAPRVA